MTSLLTLSDAVWGRAQSLLPTITPYDGEPDSVPHGQGYATIYPDSGTASSDRHGGLQNMLRWGFYVVCSGFSRSQVVDVADTVRSLFGNWAPDTHQSASPLTETDLGADLVRDTSVPSDIRWSLTLRFTLTTTRS